MRECSSFTDHDFTFVFHLLYFLFLIFMTLTFVQSYFYDIMRIINLFKGLVKGETFSALELNHKDRPLLSSPFSCVPFSLSLFSNFPCSIMH